MGTAAVAILIRRERQIVEALRQAGALTPDKAIRTEAIGMHQRIAFGKLRRRGVIREAAPDYYYLDEARWQMISQLRRRVAVVAVIAMIIGGLILYYSSTHITP